MEYVWGLHPFTPEHDDEIEFKAGERILVVEKDDVYQDGWWRGTNHVGKTGLFPQGYTTNVPPASFVASTSASKIAATTTLSSLAEDEEPLSSPDDKDGNMLHQVPPIASSTLPSSGATISTLIEPVNGPGAGTPSQGTVLHATMTDIQEAIERLGVRQETDDSASASRSFSFASTKDDTTTDDDGDDAEEDGDREYATGWNKDARKVLAANAAKQQAQKAQASMLAAAALQSQLHHPPIDVEMSDESEDEGGEHHRSPLVQSHEISSPLRSVHFLCSPPQSYSDTRLHCFIETCI